MKQKKKEIEYYTEIVKENIDYYELGDWLTEDGRDGYANADDIVGFIVNEICSPMPYTILRKQKFYRETMRSKMLKVDINMVQTALIKMPEVDGIHDFRKYFISTLYNEAISYNFNEGCESK